MWKVLLFFFDFFQPWSAFSLFVTLYFSLRQMRSFPSSVNQPVLYCSFEVLYSWNEDCGRVSNTDTHTHSLTHSLTRLFLFPFPFPFPFPFLHLAFTGRCGACWDSVSRRRPLLGRMPRAVGSRDGECLGGEIFTRWWGCREGEIIIGSRVDGKCVIWI